MSDAGAAAPDAARPVIAIVGPTAVGKSAVAEGLALALGGEIVSADSMQVYRGMDIGTAKQPFPSRRVRYHCIDLVEPGAPYSAAVYQHDARAAFEHVRSRACVPVLVGGTGLYVRAALDDMEFPDGELDSPLRTEIESQAAKLGAAGLHRVLSERDPASADLIHPNNVRRTVRALELIASGRPSYAQQAAGFAERRAAVPATLIGLNMDRAVLYSRIDARVDAMVDAGLLDEVGRLLESGYRQALTASQAIGYKELVAVVKEGADLGTALDAVKQATRRYAKRQLTWFRADPRVSWIDVTELSTERAVSAASALVESESGH